MQDLNNNEWQSFTLMDNIDVDYISSFSPKISLLTLKPCQMYVSCQHFIGTVINIFLPPRPELNMFYLSKNLGLKKYHIENTVTGQKPKMRQNFLIQFGCIIIELALGPSLQQ